MNNEIICIGDKSYIKAKVVMLATEKTTKLVKSNSLGKLKLAANSEDDNPLWMNLNYTAQHLHFITDEKIKEDNIWCIEKGCFLVFWSSDLSKNTASYYNECKKIVATTDDNIAIEKDVLSIYQGRFYNHYPTEKIILPRPSDSFLKAYVKAQGKIEDVLIECHVSVMQFNGEMSDKNQIKVAPDNTITIHPIKDSFTQDEMFLNMQYYMEYCKTNGYVTPQTWLNNHKHF